MKAHLIGHVAGTGRGMKQEIDGLLLEGIVLRLQTDLRWLEACERNWTKRKGQS